MCLLRIFMCLFLCVFYFIFVFFVLFSTSHSVPNLRIDPTPSTSGDAFQVIPLCFCVCVVGIICLCVSHHVGHLHSYYLICNCTRPTATTTCLLASGCSQVASKEVELILPPAAHSGPPQPLSTQQPPPLCSTLLR
jgi:hypothetical protein